MAQSPVLWKREFTFRDTTLYYNRSPYNNRAERAVEIPIAFDFLARQPRGGSILEVGNVLQYYENALSDHLGIRARHIVDKFEVGQCIENIDILDLHPEKPYQTIVSVSTVEHVGQASAPSGLFGEQNSSTDLEAPLKAIVKMYDLLAPNGHALVTVPFGKLTDGGWYIQFSAEYLDLLVTKYAIPREALSVRFLKCLSREGSWNNPYQSWRETTAEELSNVKYDTIRGGARAIAVIELTKQDQPFVLNLDVPITPLQYEGSQLARGLIVSVGFLLRGLPLNNISALFFASS
jgi:hypothetical protein